MDCSVFFLAICIPPPARLPNAVLEYSNVPRGGCLSLPNFPGYGPAVAEG